MTFELKKKILRNRRVFKSKYVKDSEGKNLSGLQQVCFSQSDFSEVYD